MQAAILFPRVEALCSLQLRITDGCGASSSSKKPSPMPKPGLLAPFSSRAADQRPHSFGVSDGDPNSLSPPDRTHLKNARIESAISMGTSERIQQHLESGNAIYLGLDPRDSSRILRDNASDPDGILRDFKFGNGYGPGRHPLFDKILCGLSLDCVAKIALGLSLYLSGYTFLNGLTTFAGKRSCDPRLYSTH
jgi:hypothetical protein